MSVYRKLASELSYLTGGYLVKPDSLFLITTFRCNLECPACAIWQKKDFSGGLSNREWLRIADELSNIFPAETYIEINGGEPLLNKELTIGLIKDLSPHFSNLVLNTNGSLIDAETAGKLADAGLDKIKVSFYSLDKKIHNSMRGSSIAYDKARQAIDLILDEGINLEAGILITKENIHGLPELIGYLSERGATVILQPLDEIIESNESKREENYLPLGQWPDKGEIETFFSWLKPRINQLKIKTPLFLIEQIEKYYLNPESVINNRCFVGQRNLVIYPSGEVAFCFKSGKIGNLKNGSIRDILRSKSAAAARKEIRNCPKFCRIVGCNFSRGIKEFF